MSRKKKTIIIISAVILIALSILVYFRFRSIILASERRGMPTPFVEVTTPVRGSISNVISFSGDFLAREQTSIFSRVNGNIEKIFVDAGDYVSAGKILASIDKSTYRQTVKQTEGILKVAEATAENDRINLERTKLLFEKGLASQSDYDNARTKLDVSTAQVETAKANLENAMLQLGFCDIKAPFSGYITKKLLDRGTYVSATGAAQNTIFVLSDIRQLKIMVNVLERDLTLLNNVSEVKIKTDSYPDKVFSGRFNKISQAVDLSTRTMPVQIDIDNSNELLKPGMFAKVEIVLETKEGVMKLPEQCVINRDDKHYVYVIDENMTAGIKYVTPGITSNNETEITDGLNETDKVVKVGQELISDKAKVKIAEK